MATKSRVCAASNNKTVSDLMRHVPMHVRWDKISVNYSIAGIAFRWDEADERKPLDRKLIEIDVEISNLQKEREDILNGKR